MAQGGFPFLSLPLELRRHIYSELLTTPLDKPVLLWHDRNGREKSISIYPQILRVCKRINTEATPLLYECNKFSLSLTTPESYCCGPRQYIERSQALIRDEPVKWARHFEQPGLLLPSCLQRLAHLEIVISNRSIWANKRHADVWSGTGDLFVQLLQLLASAEISESPMPKKQLVIKLEYNIDERFGKPLLPRLESGQGFKGDRRQLKGAETVYEICPLIRAISKKRDVYLYEVSEERTRADSPDGADDDWETRSNSPEDCWNISITTRQVSMEEFQDL
ncbi:MAG: hypothetical protein Q9180_006649 [Flavoplaca navasiana]